MKNISCLACNLNRHQLFTVIHALVWILLVIAIYKEQWLTALNTVKPFGITDEYIIDFPYHFNVVKEAWLSYDGGLLNKSIYSVENQLNVTSNWAGRNVAQSLSFGYSPTLLWLLAPLIFLSHSAAFCIFNLVSLWCVWWQTRPSRCRFGFGLLSFLSPLLYACVSVGQTALLTGASLLFIFENTNNSNHNKEIRKAIFSSIVLWGLTAKPPLALTAGVVLVALRKWRPLIYAVILTVVMTLAISPLLGPHWIADYLDLVSRYNLVEADKAFAWSHFPAQMATLRSILHVDFHVADHVACRIATITWLCLLTAMMIVAPRVQLRQEGWWALGILFYLLFCPHVSSTEELQLVLLIPLLIPVMKDLTRYELVLFAFLLVLPFFSPVVGPLFVDARWGLFSAKLILVFAVLFFYRGEWQKDQMGTGLHVLARLKRQVC